MLDINDTNNTVTAQNTILGWVVASDFSSCSNVNSPLLTMHTCVEIDKTLQMFWKSEELQIASTLTSVGTKCEQIYNETVSRNDSGKYIVQLPFDESSKDLGNSYRSAV